LSLARPSPSQGFSPLAPRQPPKGPAALIAFFCNPAPVLLALSAAVFLPAAAAGGDVPPAPDQAGTPALRQAAARLIQASTRSDRAFQRLCYLCDTFGPRFSGTTNLEAAIDWILAEAAKDGFDNVHGEAVSVPHWVRGEESLAMLQPLPRTLRMTGLGGSIATPREGIEAETLVVRSFEELRLRAAEARGRIVLFNAPFVSYGETVQYRYNGAVEAAKAGAVASLIRSVTPYSLQTPHTGLMHYQEGVVPIPHAAVTIEDAEMLQRMQDRGQRVVLRLKMEAKTLPNAQSRNVIVDLRGREKPEEIVVVSGHIDSWDNAPGALDDGGGVMAAWEALRLMKELGPRPRRTCRMVLWTNEENGFAGASAYRKAHFAEMPRHTLAIESDIGVFKPVGYMCSMSGAAMAQVAGMAGLLREIGAGALHRGRAGGDLGPLQEEFVPCMSLQTEERNYFWFHHTRADTPDKINPSELNLCAASMAVIAYQAAEWPELLPR
jgi:carboxypeptidase Q